MCLREGCGIEKEREGEREREIERESVCDYRVCLTASIGLNFAGGPVTHHFEFHGVVHAMTLE